MRSSHRASLPNAKRPASAWQTAAARCSRTIALCVIPVDSPEAAIEYLRSHAITIEGFAVAGERAGVVEAAIRAGATRITAFGELQHPPLAGNHGGRPRIAEFVRWFERTE